MWGVALTYVIKLVIGIRRPWSLPLSGNAVAGNPRLEHLSSGFGDGRVCRRGNERQQCAVDAVGMRGKFAH